MVCGVQETQEDAGTQRIAWAKQMRLKFSPAEILRDDGSIDQEFFKPKKVIVVQERVWGRKERDLLFEGIEHYGVGQWKDISSNLLPDWGEQAIRLWTMRMLGSQSLARYIGWKASQEEVEEEREKNRDLGKRLGCWKGGMLVEDDEGTVAMELEKAAAKGPLRDNEHNQKMDIDAPQGTCTS